MEQRTTVRRIALRSATGLRDDVKDEIERQVAFAYFSRDEILDRVLGVFDGLAAEYRPALVRAIDEAFARRDAESERWPRRTDCDLLFNVFGDLERTNILAVENCGVNMPDGIRLITRLHDARHARGWRGRGYCFYHEQDIADAIEGEGLMLAFGAFDSHPRAPVEIGRLVVAACRARGLAVEWSGDPGDRIALPELIWQCRPRWNTRPANSFAA
jgi:hypothetical protein